MLPLFYCLSLFYMIKMALAWLTFPGNPIATTVNMDFQGFPSLFISLTCALAYLPEHLWVWLTQ